MTHTITRTMTDRQHTSSPRRSFRSRPRRWRSAPPFPWVSYDAVATVIAGAIPRLRLLHRETIGDAVRLLHLASHPPGVVVSVIERRLPDGWQTLAMQVFAWLSVGHVRTIRDPAVLVSTTPVAVLVSAGTETVSVPLDGPTAVEEAGVKVPEWPPNRPKPASRPSPG